MSFADLTGYTRVSSEIAPEELHAVARATNGGFGAAVALIDRALAG